MIITQIISDVTLLLSFYLGDNWVLPLPFLAAATHTRISCIALVMCVHSMLQNVRSFQTVSIIVILCLAIFVGQVTTTDIGSTPNVSSSIWGNENWWILALVQSNLLFSFPTHKAISCYSPVFEDTYQSVFCVLSQTALLSLLCLLVKSCLILLI